MFGWLLLVLSFIDLRSGLLPNELTVALSILGFLAVALIDSTGLGGPVAGAVIALMAFALVHFIYRLVLGTEVAGLGDAKLIAVVALWIGPEALGSLFLGSAAAFAIVMAVWIRGTEKALRIRVPFGPSLTLVGWLIWLYGPMSYRSVQMQRPTSSIVVSPRKAASSPASNIVIIPPATAARSMSV